MQEAQQEIRNTVTVNTCDINTKASESKDPLGDGEKHLTRKKGGMFL